MIELTYGRLDNKLTMGWHCGNPWPKTSGRVYTIAADGDEAEFISALIRGYQERVEASERNVWFEAYIVAAPRSDGSTPKLTKAFGYAEDATFFHDQEDAREFIKALKVDYPLSVYRVRVDVMEEVKISEDKKQ